MKHGRWAIFWPLLFGLLQSTALAAERILAPASDWSLLVDTEQCTLARSFGAGEYRAMFRAVRLGPGDGFMLVLAGKPFAQSSDYPRLSLRFGNDGRFLLRSALAGLQGRTPTLLMWSRLDNLDWQKTPAHGRKAKALPSISALREAEVNSLHIRIVGRSIALQLGSMAQPMAALRTCTDQLVRSWGLDPAEQAALTHLPQPLDDPAQWLRREDYPVNLSYRSDQALIAFRLMVDAAGRPTACRIQMGLARDPAFAQTTCNAMMRRARFAPAMSRAGTAVASYYTDIVEWLTF